MSIGTGCAICNKHMEKTACMGSLQRALILRLPWPNIRPFSKTLATLFERWFCGGEALATNWSNNLSATTANKTGLQQNWKVDTPAGARHPDLSDVLDSIVPGCSLPAGEGYHRLQPTWAQAGKCSTQIRRFYMSTTKTHSAGTKRSMAGSVPDGPGPRGQGNRQGASNTHPKTMVFKSRVDHCLII